MSGVERYRTRNWWNAWRVCQYWRGKERQHRSCKGVSPENLGILKKKARRRNMIVAGELNEGLWRMEGSTPSRKSWRPSRPLISPISTNVLGEGLRQWSLCQRNVFFFENTALAFPMVRTDVV